MQRRAGGRLAQKAQGLPTVGGEGRTAAYKDVCFVEQAGAFFHEVEAALLNDSTEKKILTMRKCNELKNEIIRTVLLFLKAWSKKLPVLKIVLLC